MLTQSGSMIKTDIIASFNAAVSNEENINSSGGINWDYVEADLFMDLGGCYAASEIEEAVEVLVDNFYAK